MDGRGRWNGQWGEKVLGRESKLCGEGGYDIRIFNPGCFVVDAFEIEY